MYLTNGLPWKCDKCGEFTQPNLVHICKKWEGGVVIYTFGSKQLPASMGWRGRFGNWLISLGVRIAKSDGKKYNPFCS